MKRAGQLPGLSGEGTDSHAARHWIRDAVRSGSRDCVSDDSGWAAACCSPIQRDGRCREIRGNGETRHRQYPDEDFHDLRALSQLFPFEDRSSPRRSCGRSSDGRLSSHRHRHRVHAESLTMNRSNASGLPSTGRTSSTSRPFRSIPL